MMFFTWDQLNERCKDRPAGYREAVMEFAVDRDDRGFRLSAQSLAMIRERFNLPLVPEHGGCQSCGG